ncbi:HEAT repeat-containing protein 6 isoform X1 [Rhagoletis pomonella]|uniref:HEAT repeat-containing protein 6 isoform X1 n=1 Tax=Rhagoletis pomonella TaxID=28610 RepID=UPI0017831872|nr:HEAT repeat-containing protein 6 isoform X1 [Rhagoletis pomonella]
MGFSQVFQPKSLIYSRLNMDKVKKCDDYVLSILECIDMGINAPDNVTLSYRKTMTLKPILEFLIRLHNSSEFSTSRNPLITYYSLNLIRKLICDDSDGLKLYMAELLGISLGLMFFGNPIKEKKQLWIRNLQPLRYFNTLQDEVDMDAYHKIGVKIVTRKRNRGTRNKGVVHAMPESAAIIDKPIEDKVTIIQVSQNHFHEFRHDVYQSNLNIKIRLTALSLLSDITKLADRYYLYSFWQSIFPSEMDDANARHDILLVCQTDTSSRCRCYALQVCADLFLNSRSLFSQAEYKYRSTAFVPYSQKLGLTILSAYKALTMLLEKEVPLPELIQALKCSAALVQVTPFDKFECSFVHNFVNAVGKLCSHNDLNVQVSAFTVLECLLMEPEMPLGLPESLGIFKQRLLTCEKYRQPVINCSVMKKVTVNGVYKTVQESENKNWDLESSWLVLKVFDNLKISHSLHNTRCQKLKTCNTLRIKSLHMLSALATHFELFLKNNLEEIAMILEDALSDSQLEIRLCGSKCLETCVHQMTAFLHNNDNTQNIDICTRFLISMLPVIINLIPREKETAVKITLCDTISSISGIVFENLVQSIRITLLSFLTGMSSDPTEEVIIRATAVRALSVFVTFPSMRIDLVFIENTAGLILRLAKDKNIAVRIKILWSMGNISDALLENSMDASNESISDEVLLNLIRYSTEACNDNDKVRCNAVRTVGNLLGLLSEDHIKNILDRTLIKLAITMLIDGIRSSGTSKVKWNACYAVKNMVNNENIFLCTNLYEGFNWRSSLYPTLCHVICNHSNYKVKINATTALIHISKRKYFGEYYEMIWNTVIRAIEQSYNLQNFYEYNHRDHFQEQLCLLICHVIKFAALHDYTMFSRILTGKLEVVQKTWIRVTTRMIPEKAAPLLSCSSNLDDLLKSDPTLTPEYTNAIKLVRDSIPFCY